LLLLVVVVMMTFVAWASGAEQGGSTCHGGRGFAERNRERERVMERA
jgi:hypothetical protein